MFSHSGLHLLTYIGLWVSNKKAHSSHTEIQNIETWKSV